MRRGPVAMRLLLVFVIAGSLVCARLARAIEVPIGVSFGWADPHGALDGTIKPGWRLSVVITGDLPERGRFGASFGYQQFHFAPERPGRVIERTSSYTLHEAKAATIGLLQGEGRYYLTRSDPVKSFVEAGIGMGGMGFGYNAIGADSIGLWADGVFAFGMSAGVGAKLRVAKRLKLCADVRVDVAAHPGATLTIYSVNAGPVFLVHFPGLAEMQPGWLRRGPGRRAPTR
jgi:hypothetical protein